MQKHGKSIAGMRCVALKDRSVATRNTKLTLLRSGCNHRTLLQTCDFLTPVLIYVSRRKDEMHRFKKIAY